MTSSDSKGVAMPFAIPARTSSVAVTAAHKAKATELDLRQVGNKESRQELKRKRSGSDAPARSVKRMELVVDEFKLIEDDYEIKRERVCTFTSDVCSG
jgi:murein tripeptide amidase MpaA